MTAEKRRLVRVLLVVTFAALGLAACSSETSDRDQAIDALERANGAAALETEMAALVEDTPSDVDEAVNDIAERAEPLVESADTGQPYDEEITNSINETQGAGEQLVSAAGDPEGLEEARKLAADRLVSSNESLSSATRSIGEELADEQGNLSAADAETLELTVDTVEQSGEAVTAATNAVEQTGCSGRNGQMDDREFSITLAFGDVSCEEAQSVFMQSQVSGPDVGVWSCNYREISSSATERVTNCLSTEGEGFVVTEDLTGAP